MLIGGCPTLDNPTNGWVMYSTVSIGGAATYFCSDGYNLSDQALSQRTCNMSGMWNGSRPECRRMLVPIIISYYIYTKSWSKAHLYTCVL